MEIKREKQMSRNSPIENPYFCSLVKPENAGIVVTVQEHVVLWESEAVAGFTLSCS